jgi:signal transduction histidine kinase
MLKGDRGPSVDEVLSALPETIAQVDGDFRIRSVNRTDSPVFRRPPRPGDRLEEVFRGRTVGVIAATIDQAQRTGTAETEVDTGSEVFWVTARRLDSAPLTLLVFQDRTSLRHAEQALVDVVKDKSSFLASVSQELRTPLTAVLGYANLLAEPDPNLDEALRRAMVRDMTDQAWDLAGIVEDLLAVARTEIGELHVVDVPVNLVANVAQVIESMGGQGQSVLVKGDARITGIGDPARFRQIVRNLLSNAFTHGLEPVRVEIHANETHAALRVIDRGPGVPDALSDSIFNRYVNGGDTHAPGRVGVGLWIAKELTSVMGGQLTYRRVAGETVFQATLPLAAH